MHNLVIDKKVYCVVSLLQCYLGTLKDNAYIFEYGGGGGGYQHYLHLTTINYSKLN